METNDSERIVPRWRTIESATMPNGSCTNPTTNCCAEVNAPTSTLFSANPDLIDGKITGKNCWNQ